MISYHADSSGRILTLNYSRHVSPQEMEECVDAVRHRMDHLRPGFILLSDLTNLESMDPDCAVGLGTLMELASERGMAAVIRVIPDPSKDIGINLISQFHFRKPAPRVHVLPNLAEALIILLEEAAKSPPE
jgi:hypothetical protein